MERLLAPLAEFKITDGASGNGVFDGYASVFNIVDLGGDEVLPGAFKTAIPGFLKDGFISWGHDWLDPVAYPTSAVEDKHGLRIAGEFHSTPEAQRARTIAAERLAAGKSMGLSIGYGVEDSEYIDEAGSRRRRLKTINPLYETGFVMVPMNPEAGAAEVKALGKAAIAAHSTATSDGPWDGAEATSRVEASAASLRRLHAWRDDDGDPAEKASYKFPHHEVDADGSVGAANLAACSAGIAALNGARGGASIPSDDRQGVWAHLAKHLRDADREPPELRGQAGSSLSYADHLLWVTEEVAAFKERTAALAEKRGRDGRDLSETQWAGLMTFAGTYVETGEDLLNMLGANEPAFVKRSRIIDIERERARFLGVSITANQQE